MINQAPSTLKTSSRRQSASEPGNASTSRAPANTSGGVDMNHDTRRVQARLRGNVKVDLVTGCWSWRRNRNAEGYGRVNVDGANRYVHRVAYEVFVGPIGEGLEIDHLCRNRSCCNPAHLEPVTHAENMRRASKGQWAEVSHLEPVRVSRVNPRSQVTP